MTPQQEFTCGHLAALALAGLLIATCLVLAWLEYRIARMPNGQGGGDRPNLSSVSKAAAIRRFRPW